MSNTSSRTLRLLSLLQGRRYWPGPLLADRLQVSARTLRRDVEHLRELGYPVDANSGVDGGYALAPGAALPPLVVDDDEALALAVAVQSQLASGDAGEAALRVMTKIIQVMPKRLRTRLDAVRTTTTPVSWLDTQTAPLDYGLLGTLAMGCRDRERVEFDYHGLRANTTSRRVEPFRLISLGQRWYLVAYDLTRSDWRTFRIDRITRAASTGVPFNPRTPPFDDVAEFIRSRVSGKAAGGPFHIEVLVEAPADRVAARIGQWAQVRPESAGRCRMIMDADALEAPLFALGSIGAPFTVVEPPELGALAAEWAERFRQSNGG